MTGNSRSKPRLLILAMVILFIISACRFAEIMTASVSNTRGTYQVDPLFEEYYNRLGGRETLGPPITPLFWQDHLQLQYTEAGLMAFDPLAIPNYYLISLGLDLGYSDSIVENLGQPPGQYVGGHIIYGAFLPLYQDLGGEAVVGPPLTELRQNPEKNRLEQHFGSLGFYQRMNDPNSKVFLLAYGVYACDFSCQYSAPDSAIIERETHLPEPFSTALNFLGGAFVGEPLAGPHVARDENIEVIFENIVLYVDPNNSNRVIARPIVEYIGFTAHEPVGRLDSDLVIFFTLQGDKGHNIPVIFSNYLAQHGGLDVAGVPISELFPLEESVYRQCFSNLCLDYYENREDPQKITVAPLGSIYKSYTIRTDSDVRILDVPTAPAKIQLRVWEESAFITSLQEQTLYVSVFDDGVPLVGLDPMLTLTLPDGTLSIYRFSATDQNGMSFITIPPIEATNGTLIFYEICAEYTGAGVVCTQDNFLIWGNH